DVRWASGRAPREAAPARRSADVSRSFSDQSSTATIRYRRSVLRTRCEGAVVNRAANAEGYMLPLGGPEFWLQAELQDVMDRLIRTHFRDALAMPRAPYPRLELSGRMTSSAGRCYPDTGDIRLATLYHRDHGIDATLLVLKHKLAHGGARGRDRRTIPPHG